MECMKNVVSDDVPIKNMIEPFVGKEIPQRTKKYVKHKGSNIKLKKLGHIEL